MTLRKDRKDGNVDEETLNQYWMVGDKFAFENIGFSNAVSGVQYLICADCEIGPIGWYDKSTQSCYVSASRVNYSSWTLLKCLIVIGRKLFGCSLSTDYEVAKKPLKTIYIVYPRKNNIKIG